MVNVLDSAPKSGSPPKYVRVRGPSASGPVRGHVRQLLAEFPVMPASVIAERVGWPGSASWFGKKVAVLRAGYAPKDPAEVMVASFSRFFTGRMLPARHTADLLAGMWSLLGEQLGAVPRRPRLMPRVARPPRRDTGAACCPAC
jgi:hypothetical protein